MTRALILVSPFWDAQPDFIFNPLKFYLPANGNHQWPLAQPNPGPLADSFLESAKYNRGP
jgi:hypothetical protein